MRVRSSAEDLHGSAPDSSPVVLLVIDAINDFTFAEGRQVLADAYPMAERIAWAQAPGPGGRAFRPFTSTTTSAAGGRTSAPGRALPARRRARAAARDQLLRPGPGRLLRAEAQALGVLLDHARHCCSSISGSRTPDPDRDRGQHLRPVHRQRRLHARLRSRGAGGLRGREHRVAEDRRRALDQMRRVLEADTRLSTALDLGAMVRRAGRKGRGGR